MTIKIYNIIYSVIYQHAYVKVANRIGFLLVEIFNPGTAQTGFSWPVKSQTSFSSSGTAQNGFFFWDKDVYGFYPSFSSSGTSKLACLRTA